MSQNTLQAVRIWLQAQNLDALLVTQPHNRSYLSGWLEDDAESLSSLLIGRDEGQHLLTNALYAEIAATAAPDWQIVIPPARDFAGGIALLAAEHGWQRIAFEGPAISYSFANQLFESTRDQGILWQAYEQTCIEDLRERKTPTEIDLLRKAIDITDQTFTHLCSWIEAGMTEKQVEWEIYRKMAELGADGPSFTAIVASGPNSSMPHANPGSRQIQNGEFITIDMGARYHGYCADMTRTICLGEPAEARMQEIYDAVLHSINSCEEKLYAGISGYHADALTRDVLKEYDLAEYYVHSAGHGVGLQIHEAPALSWRAPEDQPIPDQAIITIEPGVYIPNWGGVRIEDCILLTEAGPEVLTHSHKNLVIQR